MSQTERSLILSDHEARAAARGELGLVLRPMKPQPVWRDGFWAWCYDGEDGYVTGYGADELSQEIAANIISPFGQAGETRWIAETSQPLAPIGEEGIIRAVRYRAGGETIFKPPLASDEGCICEPYSPPLDANKMPRELSRFNSTCQRVEARQIQSITEEEAQALGVVSTGGGRYWIAAHNQGFQPRGSAIQAAHDLWDSRWAKKGRPWAANPWAWFMHEEVERS